MKAPVHAGQERDGQVIATMDGVWKTYPGAAAPAVRDLTLSLRRGEFFSLLGPSGCGKSTTLRILAGLELQTHGTVHIDGRDMAPIPPNRRPTNMVFQRLELFPHLDVAANVAFGLRLRRAPRAERAAAVREALEFVELVGFERRRPEQLSGGEQQRVAIARALVNRPAVLLLDEPLAALDLKLRQQMQETLRALQRESRTTFLFVTHDQSEAMTLSDRIGVMDAGAICQVGTAEDLYRRPATRFVATFIGDANILAAAVADGVADIGGRRLRSGPGRGTALSVRPEDITIASDAIPDTVGLDGQIMTATFLGAAIRYQVRTDAGLDVRVLRRADLSRLAVGEHVSLRWRPEDAVVLGG